MTVAYCAVVRAPVVHNIVSGLEGAALLAVSSRCEPCTGPCVICSLPELVVYLIGELDCVALADLEHRP